MSILLPLEARLQKWAGEHPNEFPVNRVGEYWDRYRALLSFLQVNIYPNINAGLACLSKSPGIYTDHGSAHFDEVVRYAGLIIEPTFGGRPDGGIKPYELYLLLAAIRLHDAGNIDGREQHERHAYSLLREAGPAACADDSEAHLIAEIAQAHGGRTASGDQDTIGALPSESHGFGPIGCNPRALAALVRFSDEICEHHNRASLHHLQRGTLPAENKLFHLYAQGVKQAQPIRESKSFRLRLEFDAEHLVKRYPTPRSTAESPEEKYLLDDALDRIQKLDSERIYCNRFVAPELRTERIDVTITIKQSVMQQGMHIRRTLRDEDFRIEERGYPSPNNEWRLKLTQSEISGDAVATMLAAENKA